MQVIALCGQADVHMLQYFCHLSRLYASFACCALCVSNSVVRCDDDWRCRSSMPAMHAQQQLNDRPARARCCLNGWMRDLHVLQFALAIDPGTFNSVLCELNS